MTEEETKEKAMEEDESHRSSTGSITEDSEDRISQLPNCLLVHILSFLYLDEAVKTCLLSKRWQFIWTGILKVDFRELRSKDKKIQTWDWFGKMLALCNYLKKLYVCLEYGDFLPSDVDNWIQLAIKNKVRSITLSLSYPTSGKSNEEIYKLPEELYSYSSLTKLSLYNCMLAPQGIITWGSLIKLRVRKVDLSDSLMEKILSGSPNLTTLEIFGYNNQLPNISAPHLRNLLIDNWGINHKRYNEEHENLQDDNHEEGINEDDDHEEDINEDNDHEEDNEEFDEDSDEEFNEEIYEPLEELYSYSSLTKLSLEKCLLAPQGIIAWGSLKSFRVQEVELSDSLMEKILSGCPVLEFLKLVACSGLNNLNIYSPNLAKLDIFGYNDQLPNISAPHLRTLLIENEGLHDGEGLLKSDQSEHFMLKNLSSIVEVQMETWMDLSTSASSESTMNHMKQILQSLKSVKTIYLSEEYLPVISSLEVEGWEFPLFNQLQYLKLHVSSHKLSTILGILVLLRSSPNLEALDITIYQQEQDNSPDEDRVSLHKYETDLVASHLKTMKFHLYYGRDLTNEYMLTLISILLKSAKVLEEMTIKVEEDNKLDRLIHFLRLVERLLISFPRTSTKAVTMPCSHMGIFSWRFATP